MLPAVRQKGDTYGVVLESRSRIKIMVAKKIEPKRTKGKTVDDLKDIN